jgi:hypothetical protein
MGGGGSKTARVYACALFGVERRTLSHDVCNAPPTRKGSELKSALPPPESGVEAPVREVQASVSSAWSFVVPVEQLWKRSQCENGS